VAGAAVGVVLGAVSGLVGIDVDGPEGEAALEALSGGDLPSTLAFTTGRGFRLLYRLPAGTTAATRHGVGGGGGGRVSILGEGALTVMPPSGHVSGRRYRWRAGEGPARRQAALAPQWLTRPRCQAGGAPEEGVIVEGERNTRLFRLACALRRHGGTGEAIARLASRYRPAV
jgi:hypothetical protein